MLPGLVDNVCYLHLEAKVRYFDLMDLGFGSGKNLWWQTFAWLKKFVICTWCSGKKVATWTWWGTWI
jgi:hypothetical protein